MQAQSENSEGLHQRYQVAKVSGPTDPNAEYFVLWLDAGGSDPKHIAACRKALMSYADEIEPHLPDLASDLRAKYGQ